MGKITEYQKVSTFDENDVLLKDGTNGTKTISVADAANAFADLNGTAAEIADLQAALASSASVTYTVNGRMATITDGANDRLVEATIMDFAPEFRGSGTVSPTNPRLMSGHTVARVTCSGKNLFDKDNYIGNNIICSAADGSTTGTVIGTSKTVSTWMPLPGGYTYAISCLTHSSTAFRVTATAEYARSTNTYKTPILYTRSDPSANTIIFEAPAETKWIGITLLNSGSEDVTTLNAAVQGLQVEVASTASTYEAFSGTHASVTLPTETGPIYCGTYSFMTGRLRITHRFEQYDGTESWTLYGASGTPYFAHTPEERVARTNEPIWCSHLVRTTLDSSNNNVGMQYFGATNIVAVRPGSSIASTVAELKTWLASQATAGTPLQVVYPLETIHEYRLSPSQLKTNLGENYVFGDGGDIIEVRYVADLKLFIAKWNGYDRAMVAAPEVSAKATKNYTVGDYLTIGIHLYRVTANIANGGTISTSTNVVETTVGEELTALRNS